MPSANPSPTDAVEALAEPVAELVAEARRPRAVAPVRAPAAPSAFTPGRCARWARAEGLRAGELVALLMRDPAEIAALRLGLARVGVRAVTLDAARDLTGCGAAIVDAALAGAYAALLARVEARPAVWWSGPGADLARLDLALAEHDDAPLSAAELLG